MGFPALTGVSELEEMLNVAFVHYWQLMFLDCKLAEKELLTSTLFSVNLVITDLISFTEGIKSV